MTFDVANLKVGDEVGWSLSGYDHDNKLGVVTKINGHGHITVQVRRDDKDEDGTPSDYCVEFDKRGRERGRSTYSGRYLRDPEAVRASIAVRELQQTAADKAREIIGAIESCRHSGKYWFDRATKEKLLKLVNELPVNSEED